MKARDLPNQAPGSLAIRVWGELYEISEAELGQFDKNGYADWDDGDADTMAERVVVTCPDLGEDVVLDPDEEVPVYALREA